MGKQWMHWIAVGWIPLLMCGTLQGQSATQFNYAEALQKSIFFYEAQRSGPLPSNNRVNWRGDSALADGSDNKVDLTGGWYDAGDHVKFGFPMAGTATLLAWGVLEYPDAFVDSRQMAPMLESLRWVSDYFLKASAIPDQLWGQVGNGQSDHAWWGPAEVLPMFRPSYRITADCPGSDLAGETAAALAAASLVFRSQGDPDYAVLLLARARALHRFAVTYRGRYSECIPDAAAFYQSFSGFNDELVWSAAWLYKATREAEYLNQAGAAYQLIGREQGTPFRSFKWTHSWDDKSYGAGVLLAQLTRAPEYRADTERWLDYWTSGFESQRVRYTPGGLAWLDQWGSLRYAANTAFLAFVYSDWLQSQNLDLPRATRYLAFAERQINYILGDNPRQSSYVVGFGNNPPKNPHHRTAHGSWADDITQPSATAHILYGALVGGPDASDGYADSRTDYVRNEVATDYNAAFTGALARMFKRFGGAPLANFPVPEPIARDEIFVEATINAQAANFIEVAAYLNNQSAWPARAARSLSLRYFFTLESDDPADISLGAGFNQCSAPTGPVRWAFRVFYVQVSCAGQTIAPAGQGTFRKQTQFRITSRADRNPENDWSIAGLTFPSRGIIRTSRIVLYDGNVRVWGEEPPTGPALPLAVTTEPDLPAAIAGAPYRAVLNASGGTAPYRRWEVLSGTLPEGLKLDGATGEITGLPIAVTSTSFEAGVTDTASTIATKQFNLEVGPARPLVVATRAFAAGFVGMAYSASLLAEGGIQPHAWRISEGNPPPGLSITGAALSGTPELAGVFQFTLVVTDRDSNTAERTLELEIKPRPRVEDSILRVQYRTNFIELRGIQAGPQFRIVSAGAGDVPLSELTVRYYFTLEDPRPLNNWCDWASFGCENVRARFVDLGGGKFYLEHSFTVTAGVIQPGSTVEVQSRFAKDDWSLFDQSNDYSFDASNRDFGDSDRIVLYRGDALIWGSEPSP
jgi:hypothetical protein